MKLTLSFFLLMLCQALGAQTLYPEINQEIEAGNFTKAQQLIGEKIQTAGLSSKEIYDLELQSAILDRIRLDFRKTEEEVKTVLAKYYPELSEGQLEDWEATNELEMRMIDGEKRYFNNAVWNLFRINAAAKKQKEAVDGKGNDKLAEFLKSHLPEVVSAAKREKQALVLPETIRYTYTLKVKPDAVPDGEIIRAWMPYPRNDRGRLTNIRLLQSSETNYVCSPEDYFHSSIYMEKRAVKGEWTVFEYQVEYQAYNEWNDLWTADIQPYYTESDFYKYYTSERETHIRFTDKLKALSEKIVGNETVPLKKAWLIYQWIGENVPWASALEYSTMPDIPSYCIDNKSGDCGMKALLFITLCRYNGIPAKWQSGWFLYPVSKNLHDWTEIYFEGPGWVPVDPDFNMQDIEEKDAARFFFGGADAYRLIVNDDYSRDFFPAKIHHRSETVDFQRGEVEWRGGNLYFNQWRYSMQPEFSNQK